MKLRRNPFQTIQASPSLVIKGGTPEADLWFWRTGRVEPNLEPVSKQEQELLDIELNLLLIEASENLAKEEGIESEAAWDLFFDQKSGKGQVVKAAKKPGYYLSGSRRREYIKLNRGDRNVPTKAATLLVQHRLLFSIALKDPAEEGQTILQIYDPWFEIEINSAVRFVNGSTCAVKSYSDGLLEVRDFVGKLCPGDAGFILDSDGQYLRGFSISDEEVQEFLDVGTEQGEDRVQSLFNFYQEEKGLIKRSGAGAESGEIEGKSEIISQKPRTPLSESEEAA